MKTIYESPMNVIPNVTDRDSERLIVVRLVDRSDLDFRFFGIVTNGTIWGGPANPWEGSKKYSEWTYHHDYGNDMLPDRILPLLVRIWESYGMWSVTVFVIENQQELDELMEANTVTNDVLIDKTRELIY